MDSSMKCKALNQPYTTMMKEHRKLYERLS